MTQTRYPQELHWLLDDLVRRIGEIRQAVLVSRDGLLISASTGIPQGDADRLAAVSSGLHSLAGGVREHFSKTEVKQTIVELDDSLYFLAAAGEGTCLGVLADAGGNIGLVGYEMATLTTRLHKHLGVAARITRPHT
ncbi:hypothetical protein EDD29_5479 [Actinocorallia herbida]|uniref:Roadblock/LAMTOR2 domain-containing protein n=1 Tax=Actinocorallia herbida TaxID=58109 RepID=A0A3N1D2S2_9ACTN|nr:roadblock/LC7 domain-containing protein [Actinocorallia herbida]ROO87834.1 hypothetical protein EDD29_5479 [Actinocorallia herbida]